MAPRITFCSRCRGMRAGWNKRYVSHLLFCKHWLRKSFELTTLAGVLTGSLLLASPEPIVPVISRDLTEQPVLGPTFDEKEMPVAAEVRSIDAFLKRHDVREENRERLAESIVTSARKYNLNPKLIASVLIVESRGNPFAISGKSAIGIMQIHVPTWGEITEREGINLFKIEDNVDFGARILRDYTRQFGLWEGVKRYNGYFVDDPASEQSADEYVAKVQRIFGFQQPAGPEPSVVQETSEVAPATDGDSTSSD